MKRVGFAKQLEKLNSKQLEAFEDFLAEYLPYDYIDTDYSDKLYNKFYELPEDLQYGAFLAFLRDRDLLKDELDFSIITNAFKK